VKPDAVKVLGDSSKSGILHLDLPSFQSGGRYDEGGELLTRILLNSRLVHGVYCSMGDSFHAKWEKQISASLDKNPWSAFFSKSATMPDIRVRANRSRLLNEKYISSVITRSFNSFKGNRDDSQLQKKPIKSSDEVLGAHSPSILAVVEKDIMQLYTDMGGIFLNNHGFEDFAIKSRLALDDVTASACAMSIIESSFSPTVPPVHIWDPFVGSGRLMFALASILNGLPAGSPALDYPLRHIPFIGNELFLKVANQLDIVPMKIAHAVSLTGTDSSIEGMEIGELNLSKFKSQTPRLSDGMSALKTPIHFERIPDAFAYPLSSANKKFFIATVLPCGGDIHRRVGHFHKVLNDLRQSNRLIGCAVVTNKSKLFRKSAPHGTEWKSDLKFYDTRGRELELVRLLS